MLLSPLTTTLDTDSLLLQRIVGKALNTEELRLANEMKKVPSDITAHIRLLMDNKVNSSSLKLGEVIQPPASFKNDDIHLEIRRYNSVAKVFNYSHDFIKTLGLTSEGVKHFASLVKYYGQGKLSRMKDALVPLYIICYLSIRCKTINDNLVSGFRAKLNKYKKQSNEYADDQLHDDQSVYLNNRVKLANILNECTEAKNGEILLKNFQTQIFSKVPKAKFDQSVDYMANGKSHRLKLSWQYISRLDHRLSNNLRKIFKHLVIDYADQIKLELAAIFLQGILKKTKEERELVPYADYPKSLISSEMLEIMTIEKDKETSLDSIMYEFWVYEKINHALNAGDISIDHSFNYRLYEDDLVDSSVLEDDDYIKSLDLEILKTDINGHLSNLEDVLDFQIKATNSNISDGINTFIDIKSEKTKRWTLPYVKDPVQVNHKVFEGIPTLDIADVFAIVNEKINFVSEFNHILDKNIKSDLDEDLLKAVLIAKATNHGIYRMSSLSDYTYDQLNQCNKSYVSLESINNACDLISNEINKLPIYHHYNINGTTHGGIDGQKYSTKYKCFKSRNSPKYFYLGSGISSSTLVVNHIPANATIFGADEHESRFIFDLVYNNTSDIQPKVISTDSAGSNDVNFALLHFINRDFAPCYKRINNKDNMLYGFKAPSTYKDLLIKPTHKIQKDKIINKWDEIKRIIVSLVTKKSNQSTLARKLTDDSTSKNKTKEALHEFNRILRSEYIYRYIDDENLRKSVRKSLNRNEAYHQLKRTVATINSDKLNGRDDECLTVNDACARLICEVILYYNACILSGVLKHKKNANLNDEVDLLKKVSLVAWSHINLHGNYTFKNRLNNLNLGEIILSAANSPIIPIFGK